MLESGHLIAIDVTEGPNIDVDTAEDAAKFGAFLGYGRWKNLEHQMKTHLLIACVVLALAGCNAGSMIVESDSGRTVYSKYYDAGDWLIPHHLGMSVVVDHEKNLIPVVHELQQSIGALGPSDSYATGKVTVYIWSRDREPHRVKILRISSGEKVMTPTNAEFVGAEGQRTGGEVGSFPIFNYGTKIPIKCDYELDGKPASIEFTLERRTMEDLDKYFGPGGVPPYPWYHDGKEGK